ncbi:MAG: DoxX family protein [Gammaproteobacteria bacterium]|jgi:putative oxidoreductase|uniref:DoxX family protein n=1 Tax=Acidiferrobacter sp. SPIII_3 TaxID=1281578 RepID=UPI000D727A9D|nr:DoxX family protein [Acidiferrobacter sp. SPIII_3]AWP23667.1 DoxX family protein [Acidiferrobacter sp. SPIII_3]MDA8120615.1 DoxX family protein [Gammaproteobacteria bacterium]
MSYKDKGLAVFDLIGRVLLAFIFLFAALGKIEDYEGTRLYMISYGVPGALLPVVIAVELLGSLAIMAGLWTRWAALLLALFSTAAIVIFHQNLATMSNQIITLAEVSFTGGLIILAVNGAGCLSLDALLKRNKA